MPEQPPRIAPEAEDPKAVRDRQSIRNEQTKLFAAALDRASTACFTVGIATPLAGYLYDVSQFRSLVTVAGLSLGMAGWFFTAVALHMMARRVLEGLKS